MQIPFKKQFFQSLYWNSLDSIGTQALLILHHVLVRKYFGTEFHGIFGVQLSLFYLATILINFGFDYSISPFYKIFMHDKNNVRKFIRNYFLPQSILVILFSILLWFLGPQIFIFLSKLSSSCNIFNVQSNNYLTKGFITIFCISFISESIKKTMKFILQLGFHYKVTATVEFFGMLLYLILLWLPFILGYKLNLFIFWIAFLTTSLLQLIILFFFLFYSILKLPSENGKRLEEHNITRHINQRFLKSRLYVFTNSAANQLFSSNIMVPLCAMFIGINQASFFKIVSSLSQWFTLIGQKVFGISFNAILAQAKNYSRSVNIDIFNMVSKIFYNSIFALFIFFLINGKKIVALQLTNAQNQSWAILYLMIFAAIAECFIILYEKWYIVQEKAFYLVIIQVLNFSIFYLLTTTNLINNIFSFFLVSILLKFSVFIILSLLSFYIWKLLPELKINFRFILFSLLFSIIFYFLI